MIKRIAKKILHDNNMEIIRFNKNDDFVKRMLSCHTRIDRTMINKTLFSVRLGLFGHKRNSFSFVLVENDGKIDLQYVLYDNCFKAEGSMQNGYDKEFLCEGDIVRLDIVLISEKEKEFGVDFIVSHPKCGDSRDVEFIKGYSSTGFDYLMKDNPKIAIARKTRLGEVAGLDKIEYTVKDYRKHGE